MMIATFITGSLFVLLLALWLFNKSKRKAVKTTTSQVSEKTAGASPSTVFESESGKAAEGLALYRRGKETGDSKVMRQAVEALRKHLQELPRERAPLEWANAQNMLGNALRSLGEMEANPAHLETAVAAYNAALEEFTREYAPLQWAKVQNSLGNTLRILGSCTNEIHHIKTAVNTHRAALTEFSRKTAPLEWAKTQSSLASALTVLGWREENIPWLEEAAAANHKALEVFEKIAADGMLQHIGVVLHNNKQVEQYLKQLRQKQN